MTLKHYLVLLFFSTFLHLHAQKVEIEKRISFNDFPSVSLEFLKDSFPDCGDIRYYKEVNSSGISYEAKFDYSGTLYSVEFDTIGEWLDTEFVININELEVNILNNINHYLDKRFSSWKIKKLQKQLSASGIRYEAVIKGRKNGKPDFYEFLFDSDGHYLQDEIIIFETLSNEF
ncbi:MAG: hypothetical protein AB9834_03170 [Lentimicrobium sp.]